MLLVKYTNLIYIHIQLYFYMKLGLNIEEKNKGESAITQQQNSFFFVF